MKVLIVGFDGATWDLINKFDLPNFKKLAENGVTATMKSTYLTNNHSRMAVHVFGI